MDIAVIIQLIFAFLLAMTVHEFAHAFAADKMGDSTARHMGRLSLNPIHHIDPVGTVIFPALLILSGMPILFGWAKPVPVNPANFRDKRRGMFYVSIAGVTANFLTAVLAGIAIRILFSFLSPSLSGGAIQNISLIIQLLRYVVLINLVLAFFNLIPIPPLDGSKVLLALIPRGFGPVYFALERYGFLILILLIYIGFIRIIIGLIIFPLAGLISGLPF